MLPFDLVASLATTSNRPYFLRRSRRTSSASPPDTRAAEPRAHWPVTLPRTVHGATATDGSAARRLALPVRSRVRK